MGGPELHLCDPLYGRIGLAVHRNHLPLRQGSRKGLGERTTGVRLLSSSLAPVVPLFPSVGGVETADPRALVARPARGTAAPMLPRAEASPISSPGAKDARHLRVAVTPGEAPLGGAA